MQTTATTKGRKWETEKMLKKRLVKHESKFAQRLLVSGLIYNKLLHILAAPASDLELCWHNKLLSEVGRCLSGYFVTINIVSLFFLWLCFFLFTSLCLCTEYFLRGKITKVFQTQITELLLLYITMLLLYFEEFLIIWWPSVHGH